MPVVRIAEKGCRGCSLCVDICPVDVFSMDTQNNSAVVKNEEDCIGCLSCYYLCPSLCIDITEIPLVRPYHRIEKNVAFIERFLQKPSASKQLSIEDLDIAYKEIAIVLIAFSKAVSEILGRGHKSIGRRAGTIAATHLPDIYEQQDLDSLLTQMGARFGRSFDFTYTLEDDKIRLMVAQCGLRRPLDEAGETIGKSDVCLLFHEYWASVLGVFTKKKYGYEIQKTANHCVLEFFPQ